ncbi:polysaccharide deacetylase family protein [Hufsiella ginkgonis]|uniref:Polysaccharide deacetylase family protein n=1 Tax=Hufsiella ginkgonis TaxID=2695274 RepID=A0A7K1XX30_9SPHI|nr:polysaccharide deacetylase family protein [Hufsiella ginkgonis]MXV15540.1 polysaccharide deacetylase family protein [Hufsiella ginkgonis]
MKKQGIPVLTYHAVADHAGPGIHPVHVSVESFREQMSWLAENGYRTLTTPQLLERIRNNQADGKFVTITFDDGYFSLLKHVTPILQAYNFRATLFLTTAVVGSNVNSLPLAGEISYPPGDRPLTWEELRIMENTCWDIQAHGHRHFAHNALSYGDLMNEIVCCKDELAQHLSRKVIHYAFPYGKYSTLVLNTLTKTGFEAGFSVHPGFAKNSSDLRRIPRVGVNLSDTLELFATKVTTGYSSIEEKVIAKLRWSVFRHTQLKDFLKSVKDKLAGTNKN